MRAPVETEKDYQERLALERVIHAYTHENMERLEMNKQPGAEVPYLRPATSIPV